MEKLRKFRRCGQHRKNKSIWKTQYHSLTRYILAVLSDQHNSITELCVLEADDHKYTCQHFKENPKDITAWNYDMAVMLKSVLNALANWRIRRLTNFIRFPHLAWTITTHSQKIWELWENCQRLALKTVSKCLYSARIGRPELLWTVNYLAKISYKSGTEHACDLRQARLIIYIRRTPNKKQYCHGGNLVECKLGLFQDADFAVNLTDSKSTSGGVLYLCGSHTVVPISWAL